MGLEIMVSEPANRPYPSGRSKDWIKVKNRNHPSLDREILAKFGAGTQARREIQNQQMRKKAPCPAGTGQSLGGTKRPCRHHFVALEKIV
jgi:hypothetical protein